MRTHRSFPRRRLFFDYIFKETSKRPQGRLLNFWFLQISGLLEKRHSLVGGLFVEIGDVVVVDKIVTFLVVKILICYEPLSDI